MKFITSLSPNRVERQRQCIESWRRLGADVVAVQGIHEQGVINSKFPDVTIVPTLRINRHWTKPNPDIATMIQEVDDKPALIINSDIELLYSQEEFDATWTYRCDTLLCGIRCDKNGDVLSFNPYGIDLFLIDPYVADVFPESTPFSVGCPGWDYWLPYFVCKNLNYRIQAELSPCVIHEKHQGEWSKEDQQLAWKCIVDNIHQRPKNISRWIQRQTRRAGWTHQSSYDHTQKILNGLNTA